MKFTVSASYQSFQDFKIFNLLLAPWGSYKYLAGPIEPVKDLLHAREHLLALLGEQDIYCWSKGLAKD